jgi:hypothetical protein
MDRKADTTSGIDVGRRPQARRATGWSSMRGSMMLRISEYLGDGNFAIKWWVNSWWARPWSVQVRA